MFRNVFKYDTFPSHVNAQYMHYNPINGVSLDLVATNILDEVRAQ